MLRKINIAMKIFRQYNKVKDTIEETEKKGKAWYKSKTVWVNIIALVAIIASYFGLNITEEEQLAIATAILAIVNIALRFITKEPVYVREHKNILQQSIKTKTEKSKEQNFTTEEKKLESTNKKEKATQETVIQSSTDDIDDLI